MARPADDHARVALAVARAHADPALAARPALQLAVCATLSRTMGRLEADHVTRDRVPAYVTR